MDILYFYIAVLTQNAKYRFSRKLQKAATMLYLKVTFR